MKKNKIFIYILVLVALIIIGLFLRYQKQNNKIFENPEEEIISEPNPITISTKEIKEKNFSGKVSVISGESVVAKEANTYIENMLTDFKEMADKEVPNLRKEFGADSPTSQYEIFIEAEHIQSETVEALAILTYEYTGGAHGNSTYNVMTASKTNGKILTLADVIKEDKKDALTNLVKKELMDWRPYESTDTVVFTEEVNELNFDSFVNWSLDNENLILYFSQYEVGPGALGPVAFPLPLEKIKDFFK